MTISTGPVVALVPVRAPGAGKTRLADDLTPPERAALSGSMLADVATALRGAPVDRIVVVARGSAGASAAAALGLDVILDPPSAPSLNAALHAARAHLGHVGSLLIVTADLPRLRAEDIVELVDTDAQVVVAGTADGGTGGLLQRPPGVIRTAYGPGSAAAHTRLGHAGGLRTVRLEIAGFRDDVDTWGDLVALTRGHIGIATAAFVERMRPRLEAAAAPDALT